MLLAAGLILTLLAGRRLGIRGSPLVAMLSLVTLTSTVLGSAAVVTPDAASVLAGAVVLLAAVLWERGRLPTWALAVAGGIATGIKYTNMLGVTIVAGWLLVQAVPPGWVDHAKRRLRIGAGSGGGDGGEGDAGSDDAERVAGPLPYVPGRRGTASDPAVALDDRPAAALGSRRYLNGALVLLAGAVAVAVAWSLIDHAPR